MFTFARLLRWPIAKNYSLNLDPLEYAMIWKAAINIWPSAINHWPLAIGHRNYLARSEHSAISHQQLLSKSEHSIYTYVLYWARNIRVISEWRLFICKWCGRTLCTCPALRLPSHVWRHSGQNRPRYQFLSYHSAAVYFTISFHASTFLETEPRLEGGGVVGGMTLTRHVTKFNAFHWVRYEM